VTETTALALWQQPNALARIAPVEEGEKPLTYVTRLMQMLPPPAEDAVQMFAASILNAGGPADENAFWDAETLSSKNAEGRRFIFRNCFIHDSDHPEGPFPWYLAVQVTDMESGEETILTTGSANIVTALVKAQLLGALPWEGEIVGPKRTPKSGHRPLHIRWLARIVEQTEQTDTEDVEL